MSHTGREAVSLLPTDPIAGRVPPGVPGRFFYWPSKAQSAGAAARPARPLQTVFSQAE